jgi:hypothetical protein
MIPYMSADFIAALISRPELRQRKEEGVVCALVRRLTGLLKSSLKVLRPDRRLGDRNNVTYCLELAPRNQDAVGRKHVIQVNRMVVRVVFCKVRKRHDADLMQRVTLSWSRIRLPFHKRAKVPMELKVRVFIRSI